MVSQEVGFDAGKKIKGRKGFLTVFVKTNLDALLLRFHPQAIEPWGITGVS
ncbi:hypothetical protein [Plectonema radiosum]|nr:hypothetical protein [Plectonema radiosum]